LLTAIIGFCDLLLMRHQAGDHSFSDIMQIKQNANRAANLVRQLLAFSRQQTLKPEVLSVTDVLADLTNLLRRLIGETIEMQMIHGRDVTYVKADQGQFEQIIINLAVNARDAMKGGGTLTIRTSNVAQTESVRMGHDLLPRGDYVLIKVSDTGMGIPKEHAGKIFEPFYTTKEGGAGTGLGLSTVYGIVKQFGGYVFVESEPDQGANFNIFLPQFIPDDTEKVVTERVSESKLTQDLTGQGTILLVEDEDAVRMFGARALRNKGYTVLEADSGETALELMEASEQPIDLLVTDVVMPQMDGPTLTKEVEARRPDIKVIYISGYAEDAFRSKVDSKVNFLPKPFSLSQLATKVKEVMLSES
jgi:two-component system cell cycle sensor histidine kinase/response regulator CckA